MDRLGPVDDSTGSSHDWRRDEPTGLRSSAPSVRGIEFSVQLNDDPSF
ncbi:hypothetical protein Rumeso_02486 [Rubellimicrobium mesophilum DSM 19309]|uniref:Uncharacterized protein n=1 Tax=Rubellimicrobium mesophilum DSM 19309 TaxID=442562 RepID=A0A017HNJ5_9RHOB|nr:hypothetical protein Rumeso_02486 [Rubellimicrobium mesophilum DSM 19309]